MIEQIKFRGKVNGVPERVSNLNTVLLLTNRKRECCPMLSQHKVGGWAIASLFGEGDVALSAFFEEIRKPEYPYKDSKPLIDPATVGQWTTQQDKHDKDIYLGDELRVKIAPGIYVEATVEWFDHAFCLDMPNDKNWLLYMWKSKDLEIIGSVHDEVSDAAIARREEI